MIDPTLTTRELGTLRYATTVFADRPKIVAALKARIEGQRTDEVHTALHEVVAEFENERFDNLAKHIATSIEAGLDDDERVRYIWERIEHLLNALNEPRRIAKHSTTYKVVPYEPEGDAFLYEGVWYSRNTGIAHAVGQYDRDGNLIDILKSYDRATAQQQVDDYNAAQTRFGGSSTWKLLEVYEA